MTDVRPAHVYMPATLAVTPPPTLEAFAANLYASLAPLAWMDDQAEWSLAKFSGAFGEMFQAVEEVARDTSEGPGWSAVVDLTRSPTAWLGWLAQFVGVTIPGELTDAQARAWIASTDGFRRGTVAALRGALAPTLTGTKAVYFRERYPNDPYGLQVITRVAETPNPAASEAALLAQKPGGIVLTYRVIEAWDYTEMTRRGGTYADQTATYSTYLFLTLDVSS